MGSRRPNEQDGFTIVEMMVVFLIIGILLGIAFVSYSFPLKRTKETACRSNLRIIREAIHVYRARNDAWPPSLHDLIPEYIEEGFDFKCPKPGEEYLYDPLNGAVSCPYHADF